MQEKEETPTNRNENNNTSTQHGECCEECKRTCKRNFWTEVLRTIVKVGTAVMAAFGISNFSNTSNP